MTWPFSSPSQGLRDVLVHLVLQVAGDESHVAALSGGSHFGILFCDLLEIVTFLHGGKRFLNLLSLHGDLVGQPPVHQHRDFGNPDTGRPVEFFRVLVVVLPHLLVGDDHATVDFVLDHLLRQELRADVVLEFFEVAIVLDDGLFEFLPRRKLLLHAEFFHGLLDVQIGVQARLLGDLQEQRTVDEVAQDVLGLFRQLPAQPGSDPRPVATISVRRSSSSRSIQTSE